MIERPRLFTDYSELPEIMSELETLAMDLKTITILQHDEKKNWELDEAYEENLKAAAGSFCKLFGLKLVNCSCR